jgi:DNA-binding CsgD family transcriptional regulator
MIGLAGGYSISSEAAAILIERRSALSRCEARMVVLDLLGVTREDLSDELGLSTQSIHTYWKRVYRKTGQRGRLMGSEPPVWNATSPELKYQSNTSATPSLRSAM